MGRQRSGRRIAYLCYWARCMTRDYEVAGED